MAPAAESLRGPPHSVWGLGGGWLPACHPSLQGDRLRWEECAETAVLLPACRRGSRALLEARGLLAWRFSVSPAGRFPPASSPGSRCPSARPFLSVIVLASSATFTLHRLLTVHRLVTSWRPTRMGFHHKEGWFPGGASGEEPTAPAEPGRAGARVGTGRDSARLLAAPRLLGTWCPFRPLLRKCSPPAPASPSSAGPVQPLTCPPPAQARGDPGSLCCAPGCGGSGHPALSLRGRS